MFILLLFCFVFVFFKELKLKDVDEAVVVLDYQQYQ